MTVVLLAGCHSAGSSAPGGGAARTGMAVHSTATSTGSPATGSSSSKGATTSTGTTSAGSPSAAPSKSANETIVGTPSSVTLEALLPVAPGKQRWTDQTFVITGARAQRLVAALKGMRVYTGPAPAGCQPWGRQTTIRVASGAQQLAFRSYCDLIWAGDQGTEMLTSPSLVSDVDSALARLSPTTSRRAKADVELLVDFVIVPQDRTAVRRAAGVITVTQDGHRVGSKHLAPGQHLRLQVAPGVYVITASTPLVPCPAATMTVAPGPYFGTSLSCPTRH